MPASTTSQLFITHSQFLDTTASNKEVAFRQALNEVMPRIYKMGYWREMLVEHTQDASAGYVSLPQDTDSIVAAMVDNNPIPTRSLWHDYKLFGTNDDDKTYLSSFIDDGYAPSYRDLVAGSQYRITLATLKSPFNASPTSGTLTFKYRQYSDATVGAAALVGGETVLEGESYTELNYDLGQGALPAAYDVSGDIDITKILSISWANTTIDHPFRLRAKYQGVAGASSATADSTKDLLLADINTSHGVARYRRFRVGNTSSDSTAHMLLKRRWVDVDSNSDLVHVPANSILKHALLGKLSEDNADAQRAMYHWGVVKELLEADTDSYRGASKPTLHIAPDGVGAGMAGMY